MKTVKFGSACLILGLCLALPRPAASQGSATFNFDTGTPVLSLSQSTPFDQSSGGLTAHFDSRSAGAYSVQSDLTTGWRMSRFSGNYLYDVDLARDVLTIKFSQRLNSITLTFATPDFEIEVPSTIQLTAYLDSNATTAVGSATAHGTYAGDTMPTGTLSFNSGDQPFNLVEITVPSQASGATSFFADNITVTTATLPARTVYTAEAAYLSAIGSAGNTAVQEGFENEAAWGPVRSPSAAPMVASNGIVWTSNHLNASVEPGGISTGGISTGGVAAHSGSWGGFSLPHGNSDAFNPPDPTSDGVIGTRAPGAGLLYGVGGWISGPLGGHLVMIIDGDALHPVDLGAFGSTWQFFGVTTPNGFSQFELQETDGRVPEPRQLFVDDLTLATKPGNTSIANVSAASFQFLAPLAPRAIGSSFGLGLASGTEGAGSLSLPITLANMTLVVQDSAGVEQPAPLYYASSGQINFVIPDTAALGAATVKVMVGGQLVARGPLLINAVAPGLFTANMNGTGVPVAAAVATATGGAQIVQSVFTCGAAPGSCIPALIDLPPTSQVTLMLFGTGIRGFSALSNVTATIGGIDAIVKSAGPVAGVVGLDEVDVSVPNGLGGLGVVDLVLTVDSQTANPVQVSFK